MDDNEIQEEGGLIDRIKESPRTVSALIIILIVAAAIYAFSGDEGGQVSDSEEQGTVAEITEEEAGVNEGVASDEEVAAVIGEEGDSNDGTREPKVAAETTIVKPQAVKAAEEPLPEPKRTDKAFVEVAEAGNGITHLARRASSRWLSENQAGYAVTDEHRIYIEDYIQNKIGTHGLAYGDTVEISFEMIQEAVTAAKGLNETQLDNLSQYTHVLQ